MRAWLASIKGLFLKQGSCIGFKKRWIQCSSQWNFEYEKEMESQSSWNEGKNFAMQSSVTMLYFKAVLKVG